MIRANRGRGAAGGPGMPSPIPLSRRVPCPKCGAVAGARCVSMIVSRRTYRDQSHRERMALAREDEAGCE